VAWVTGVCSVINVSTQAYTRVSLLDRFDWFAKEDALTRQPAVLPRRRFW